MWRRIQFAVNLLALALSAHAQIDDMARQRSLGTVLGRINTGKWLEFQVTTVVNRTAIACLSGCSTSPSSSLPGSNGPWTYSTSGNCSQLTVIEGSGTGDVVYTVYDNNAVLGSTSQGTAGGTCGSDPTVCYADSKTGRGQFTLPSGDHSIVILVGSTTSTDATGIDRGWFQINTTSCSGNPVGSPTKAPTSSPGTPALTTSSPTKTPTRPTPTKPSIPVKPTNSSQCWGKLKCADVIIRERKLCKCNDLLAGRKNCVNERAKRVCCPRADRPADYKRLVVAKAKWICRL